MKHVLVVEDDKITGGCLHDFLISAGYRADHVLNGEAALTALGVTPYDAMIVDVYMPGLDGLQLTRKVRELLPSHDLPVVVVTAGRAEVLSEEVQSLEHTTLVQKPFEFAQILDKLKQLWVEPSLA